MRSKIPITIAPLYWVTSALIAYMGAQKSPHMLSAMIAWMVVIFVSILVHEMGHALSAKLFGQTPVIRLVAFGGLTIPGPKKIKKWQEFIVIFCGPLFGFLLFLLAIYISSFNFFPQGSFVAYMLDVFVWVNLFWTVVNLIPVIPLDGGQLMRVVLQSLFRKSGEKIALVLSIIIGALIAMVAFTYMSLFVGIIILLFVFQNFAMLRQSQFKSEGDEKEEVALFYREGEEKLAFGDKQGASESFHKVLKEAGSGIIFSLASQQLAKMAFDSGDFEKTYHYLEPICKQLRGQALIMMHKASFQTGAFEMVKKLARESFKLEPVAEIAMINAKAYAQSGDVKATCGWLTAALEKGADNFYKELESSHFDKVRKDASFARFTKS